MWLKPTKSLWGTVLFGIYRFGRFRSRGDTPDTIIQVTSCLKQPCPHLKKPPLLNSGFWNSQLAILGDLCGIVVWHIPLSLTIPGKRRWLENRQLENGNIIDPDGTFELPASFTQMQRLSWVVQSIWTATWIESATKTGGSKSKLRKCWISTTPKGMRDVNIGV